MKRLQRTGKMIFFNIKILAGFQAVFKLLLFFLLYPLSLRLFSFTMRVTGFPYLTKENIFSFVGHPVTLLFFLFMLFLFTACSIYEGAVMITVLELSRQKKKARFFATALFALEQWKRLWCRPNRPLFLLLLFQTPLFGVGMSASLFATVSVPEYIVRYFLENPVFLGTVGVCILLSVLLLPSRIYSFHFFIIEGLSSEEAQKKSRKLSRRHRGTDAGLLILAQIALVFFYFIFIFAGVFLLLAFLWLLKEIFRTEVLSATAVWTFLSVIWAVFTSFSTPVSCFVLSLLFYSRQQRAKEPQTRLSAPAAGGNSPCACVDNIRPALPEGLCAGNACLAPADAEQYPSAWQHGKFDAQAAFTAAALLLSGVFFLHSLQQDAYNLNVEEIRTLEVTAHRGASADYPENTMSAFEGAAELEADWIELDVQQTRDGEIIVLHDTNLKRTTGVNKSTWELTLDEILQLDAGSFFDESFAGERIPLLSQVIEFAKDREIRLNIELKPTGHETDFEKTVVDLIVSQGFEGQCVVTSQMYGVLERVKEYNPDITTVYVMSLAYGSITALSAADHFSVNARSVTKTLVDRVHEKGKQLYVWTVNTEKMIARMIELNVDNIITDRISLAKETIYAEKTSGLIQDYTDTIFAIFSG